MPSDPLSIIHDLQRRVQALEGTLTQPSLHAPHPRSRRPKREDPDTAAILAYLRSNKAQREDTTESKLILAWLEMPAKKKDRPAGTGRPEVTSKGN